MAYNFRRVCERIKNYGCSKSEHSSSEDESEIFVPPLLGAIERREKLNVIKNYFNKYRINAVDELSNTCLHIAVNVVPYDLDVIKELLKHGAAINLPNWKRDTPLHTAAENPECDVDLIKVLLDNGANPNAKNIHEDTPLHVFVMKCLREQNNDRNFEIIKLLLENGAEPNAGNFVEITPFLMAIHPPYCHLSAFVGRIKFDADFSVTRSNESLLDKPLLPSSNRSLGIIKLLLQYEPLLVSCRDRKFRTALHVAVFGGASIDIVRELINKGANVNATDADGNTPLHVTTLTSYSVIETLVRYGANINAVNNRRCTPLLESIDPRLNIINPTAITALMELGAEVKIRPVFFKPPLFYALFNSSIPPDVVRMLLEKRANPTTVAIYKCFNNQHSVKLFIQFLLLYLVNGVSSIIRPEEFMKFDLYGPTLTKVFSNFRDSCIHELYQMTKDKLNKDVLLYPYLWETIFLNDSAVSNYPSFTKELLFRIFSNKYPNCRDLLCACIKRDSLIDYLSSLIVYTSVRNTSNIKQSIILNFYATCHLTKFLNKGTLLSLVEVFAGDLSIYKYRKRYMLAPT